jgi:hypothetical protein
MHVDIKEISPCVKYKATWFFKEAVEFQKQLERP